MGAEGRLVRLLAVSWGGGGKGSAGSLTKIWWEIGVMVEEFVGVGNSEWEALMGRETRGGGVEPSGLG